MTPLHKYYQDHYFYCFTHYTVTSSASPGPEVRYIMLGLGRHHATSRNIQASIYNITSLIAYSKHPLPQLNSVCIGVGEVKSFNFLSYAWPVVTKGWWDVGSKCGQISCESVMLHLVSKIVCGNHATFPVCRPSNQPIGGLGMPEEGHHPITVQHQPRPSI